MTNLPWIKLYTEIIDDPKLSPLPDGLKWRFVQLLALAGECDAEGYLNSSGSPLELAEIAWRLRLDTVTLGSDLQALSQRHLLVLDKATNTWLIPSFANRQQRPDDGTRLYWREQKRRRKARAFPNPSGESEPDSETSEETDSTPPTQDEQDSNDLPDTLAEDIPEDILEQAGGTVREAAVGNFPLKRRIEESRLEKRRKGERSAEKSRKEERQKPSPPFRPRAKSKKAVSALDQLERELSQKRIEPPGYQENPKKN